ncbi:MAG: hypothetical protein HN554_03430 [Euryarchaeota archaeon]|nr:hypothetical protein [Euryarchaeota archaeon]
MAGPSKVEFPGQKKQRFRMRGTKHANEATANKLKRELAKLLENPRAHLPMMTWKGKLRWGRTDPVTKTMKALESIIRNKDNLAWLSKRMMAKGGDPVAKAFAGSLHAAHDEEITVVGKFSSGSFGSASFIRRGEGKQGYLAGLQNYSNLTLRMLPWEDHAKRGMYFFTWKGGFVCTGPNPTPPDEWLEDVLGRSRFNFTKHSDLSAPIWVTEGLDAQTVMDFKPSGEGYIRFSFKHGPILAIGFDSLSKTEKKESSFIHHLALSMLPPFLPSILKIEANWTPKGWDDTTPLPDSALEGTEKILDAWQGLTMNEGVISFAIRRAVLDSINSGLVVGDSWITGLDFDEIEEALQSHSGSKDERNLASHMLYASMQEGSVDGEGLRITAKGDVSERKAAALEVMEGASCGNILGALWEKWGMEGLAGLGIAGVEAEEIWKKQLKKPQPFGNFLKSLDSARAMAKKIARFPTREEKLTGATGAVHGLILQGLLEGEGKAERNATRRHDSIVSAAAAWAWLLAAGRSTGQEWHFEINARDRGGAWMGATQQLLEAGKTLYGCDDNDVEEATDAWLEAFSALKTVTGEAN